MKRKKQGASLIVVIILFMFVSTVSIAMISMVAGNYKARVAESKRVENLYASDSGLDVAYNIIGKTFDAATKYGYYEVEALKSTEGNTKSPNDEKYKSIEADITALKKEIDNLNKAIDVFKEETPTYTRKQSDIDKDIAEENRFIVQKNSLILEDQNLEQILLNEEFKRTFKNFIASKLVDSIVKHRYVSEVTSIDDTDTTETVNFGIKSGDAPTLTAEIGNLTNVSTGILEGIYNAADGGEHHETVKFTVYEKQEYDAIKVISNFNTTNQRQLQANFKISVPNYKDIYFENSNVQEYLATKDRALTIYGNMNINNANDLTVSGEIFVNGSADHTTTVGKVYGKYFGGITLNKSTGVKFTNNVITRGTFNIQDATTATIDENLYARNVYVGETDSNVLVNANQIDKSQLDVSQGVIVDNDLALNANNAKITINDFYGINDTPLADTAKSSSSIIVNGNTGSTINITNSAYIMGMAHIATDSDYQTAESGTVKGNYIAYTVKLNDAEKIVSDPPLQLLEPDITKPDPLDQSITTPTAVEIKENHFKKYWEDKNPDAGGISWPQKDGTINKDNIYSSGVIIYKTGSKNTVIPSSYYAGLESPTADNNVIYRKKAEFASKVYKFDQSATKEKDYDNTLLTEFSSLINTNNIPTTKRDDLQEYYLPGDEHAIFNGNTSTGAEIQILKGASTDTQDKIDNTDPKNVKIYVGNKGSDGYTLKAVIASLGNISIDRDITINGCIIAEGDLNINGANVTIKYDSSVVDRLQVQNSDTFKTVFGESKLADANTIVATPNITDANYDLKNFLENKLWKILK